LLTKLNIRTNQMNANTEDRNVADLKRGVDLSHLLQAKGSPVAEVQAQKQVDEKPAITELNEIISNLEESRQAFEKWQANHPHIVNERLAWIREGNKSLNLYDPDDAAYHRSSEPGLASLPDVAKARKRVEAAKVELREAQADLIEVESNGTPLSSYLKDLSLAESSVSGLASSAARQRMLDLMDEHFGTRDDFRLSKEASASIRMHPSVARLSSFRFYGTLAGRGEAVTAIELSQAHKSVSEALGNLRNLISE